MQLSQDHYNSLLDDLKGIITQTRIETLQTVATSLTKGYWLLGQRLVRDRLFNDPENLELKTTLSKLSRDLKIEYSQLTRVIKFYQQFPKQCPIEQFPQLQWSHFRTLLSMGPETKRLFYLEQAQHHNWSSQALRNRIKEDFFEKAREGLTPPALSDKPALLKKPVNALHLYAGSVKKVIDGDTLIVNIDLGFSVWVEARVRLRGVNAEELSSPDSDEANAADAAKLFIQSRLSLVKTVVIQTFKTDLHGRYVADVYYFPGEDSNKERIFREGKWLNQELVEQGLVKIVG